MARKRITHGGALRRALLGAALGVAAIGALAGCGDGGPGTTTAVPDKAGDVELLNEVLARQLGAVEAYQRTLPKLSGPELSIAREFHAQEQEHVDAIVKALRGLGGVAESEPEPVEADGLDSERDHLVFLYEVESASIDLELSAISKLTASWPRSLLGTMVANQAQHLVLLRRALGADELESVPEAFENGTTAAPGAPDLDG